MGFWWVIKICWQRIFLTDLTDGFLVGDKDLLATDFFNGFNGWVFWWVIKIGWQRIFLTDLTDGFGWVITFGWQRIFLTDLTDGFLVGDKDLLATDFFNGFNGWVVSLSKGTNAINHC